MDSADTPPAARCTVYRTTRPTPDAGDASDAPDGHRDSGLSAASRILDGTADDVDLLRELRGSLAHSDFCWIDVAEPDDAFMLRIAAVFGVHELIVEDAVTAHQRPKYERYGSQVLFVMRTVNYTRGGQDTDLTPDVTTGEVQVILGPDFVVTVSHGRAPDPTDRVTTNLRRIPLPQTILYSLADEIVDHYLTVSDMLEDDVSEMESTVFAPSNGFDIQELYLMMREVLEIRHAIDPLTVALRTLHADRDILVEGSRAYVRDVLDHQIVAADRIRNYAERLTSLVDVAAAKISLQQNTDMRKISAWAAVAVVPTMIAGIYGMNFADMPELQWSFGYPLVILLMAAICCGLIAVFRRNHWL